MRKVRIVLVEPSHPGNIGGAARAMKVMGQESLFLVSPKRFPDPQADWRAAGALDVLDSATIVDSVADAISDCHWVVGTSTRLRRIPWPAGDAKETAAEIGALDTDAKVAILFGREDNGLTNDELRACHAHLQIPSNPEYGSLNLAMAVQVVCYELYQASLSIEPQKWDRPMATQGQIDAMLAHLGEVLEASDFLDADNPGQTLTRLRRMFLRMSLDETEVQILRGIYKHLDPKRR